MATVTPNFNWPVPTSTDLVKDGATAIEALGDSIDASLVDLKGGTTGQVLAKASGTDMDFSWVAQDDSNAIQNSIVNAKGDLIGASANDTPAILSVGANGETLVADSSTSTGLRWTATPSASNPVLNSSFQVWQRGTSVAGAASNTYTADRWSLFRAGFATGTTVSRQLTNDTTNLPNIQYCARVQRDSGNTSTASLNFTNNFETINAIPYVGKTVTLSLYARKGANFSQASSQLTVQLYSGTGTDDAATAYSGAQVPVNGLATLTTTWQRFQFTGTISTSAKQIMVYLPYDPTGTAGAADYFEVTGVQLDIGSTALPYRPYAATIQGELAACQRYYYRQGGASVYQVVGSGMGVAGGAAQCKIIMPVTMRTAPTVLDTSTLAWADQTNPIVSAVGLAIVSNQSSNQIAYITSTNSTTTQYRPYDLITNNSTSAFLGLGAEL
jgi:hypothetical protein